MELRQLRYFVAVARHRHFRHASEELHIAQPALSQQIKRLEEELGVMLLDRSGGRVQLTPPGELLLGRATAILEELDRLRADVQSFTGLHRGQVVIGMIGTLEASLLPPLLAAFGSRYSALDLVLRRAVGRPQLLDALRQGTVDVALISLFEKEVLRPPDGIHVETLFKEQLVVAVGPDSRLASDAPVRLAALRESPVLMSRDSSLSKVVLAEAARQGADLEVRWLGADLAMIRSLVAQGAGITILPRWAAAADAHVRVVELDPALPGRTIALVWLAGRPLTQAVKAFLDEARQGLPRSDSKA